MKRSIIISAIALAATASCVSPRTDADLLCSKEFVGYTDAEVQTRTSLGSGYGIIWEEDDCIKVFSDSDPTGTVFSDITLENGGRKAVFKGFTQPAQEYLAVYPAQDDAVFNAEDRSVTITLPTVQTATEGSFADKANPAIATTGSDDLYFRNIGAILAIKCPTAYASSLMLRSRDKSLTMSGKAVISHKENAPEIIEVIEGKDYVELTGLGSTSYGKTFYLTAYPAQYKGFDIIITNWARTHRCVISSSRNLTLERNGNILLYDGEFIGWNAPMPPVSVKAAVEADGTVSVSWNGISDETICKGYRILTRQSGTEDVPETAALAAHDETSASISGLQEECSYDIGVQAIGSEQRYDSETVWFTGLDIPVCRMYDWEKARKDIPFFADLDLLAGGITTKTPNTWNEARLKPHVTFTDENGTEQWLHEAFLYIGGEDAQTNSTLSITSAKIKSADQESWKRFADWWLSEGSVTDVLDHTIANAISRIGEPSYRHKVVMTMPDPVMLEYFYDKQSSTTYWGSIDGRQLDFSSTADQILAYEWYIDYVRKAWNKAAPEHLELAGFYILSEVLVAKPEGWNYKYKRWDKILPSVAEYLHGMKYGLYWIPYYQADGYDMTEKLGIDYTWMQPNEYWDYPEKKQKKSWTWTFDTMGTYGHGMEIEFEGSHGEAGWSQYEEGVARTSSSILETVRTSYDAQGTPKGSPNPQAARNKQLLRDYMDKFKEAGYYGKARIATYSGTDAMYELATSPDAKDREMYLEYCRFITGNPLRNN